MLHEEFFNDWQDAGEGEFCNASEKTPKISDPRNDKALNNQGFVGTNMAEAMGFELMDLLQSTVFKTVALNHSATPPLRCGRHNT